MALRALFDFFLPFVPHPHPIPSTRTSCGIPSLHFMLIISSSPLTLSVQIKKMLLAFAYWASQDPATAPFLKWLSCFFCTEPDKVLTHAQANLRRTLNRAVCIGLANSFPVFKLALFSLMSRFFVSASTAPCCLPRPPSVAVAYTTSSTPHRRSLLRHPVLPEASLSGCRVGLTLLSSDPHEVVFSLSLV